VLVRLATSKDTPPEPVLLTETGIVVADGGSRFVPVIVMLPPVPSDTNSGDTLVIVGGAIDCKFSVTEPLDVVATIGTSPALVAGIASVAELLLNVLGVTDVPLAVNVAPLKPDPYTFTVPPVVDT